MPPVNTSNAALTPLNTIGTATTTLVNTSEDFREEFSNKGAIVMLLTEFSHWLSWRQAIWTSPKPPIRLNGLVMALKSLSGQPAIYS